MKRKSFTLIELLVVVAIIGILSSLLLPSLSKAREKAKMAICKNNQKQIAIATALYMDDNDGYYPVGPFAWEGQSWDDLLGQYDGRNLTKAQMQSGDGVNGRWWHRVENLPGGADHGPMYRCPSDDSVNDTYILINYFPTQNALNNSGLGIYGFEHPSLQGWSKKSSDINKPSQTIAFTEMSSDLTTIWWAKMGVSWEWQGITADRMINQAEPYHKGVRNYNFLMGDGHVEAMGSYQSLTRNDGSLASASDVSGSIWDSTR